MKPDNRLSSFTKIKLKWINDLKIKPQNYWRKVREILEDTGIGKDFLSKTPKAKSVIPKIDKQDYIKVKSLCTAKDKINKDDSQNGRQYLQTIFQIRDRQLEYIRNSNSSLAKKPLILPNLAISLNRQFSKGDTKWLKSI